MHTASLAVPISSALLLCAAMPSQCGIDWLPTGGVAGVNGPARVVVPWDPDGTGPAPELAVVGGSFSIAGGVQADRVAAFSATTGAWSRLGEGIADGLVAGLCVRSNGELVAGGSFTTLGSGSSASGVALWDGASWSPLGGGVNGFAPALANLPNGDLVVGGSFTHAGGVPAQRIAVYHFASRTWGALGGGLPEPVEAISVGPSGEIVALVRAVFSGASMLYRWSGSAWSLVASPNGSVGSVLHLGNADLFVAGDFTSIGGVPIVHLARWDGVAWSAYAPSPVSSSSLSRATFLADGSLVYSGLGFIRRWDGAAWWSLGSGLDWAPTSACGMANGDLVVAGQITSAGGVPVQETARWTGGAWTAMGGGGLDGPVHAIGVLPDGGLVVGGAFGAAGAIWASAIVVRSGGTWTPLGTGADGVVHAVLPLPDGEIVAGGSFQTAGGVPVGNIARWDGASWHALGGGVAGEVRALCRLPNGDVIAGGDFLVAGSVAASRIARWDGTSWHALGPGCDGAVLALAVLPNGDLVAGGAFTQAGGVAAGRIARWNGAAWSPLGSGIAGNPVIAMHVRPNGDLIVGGTFTVAGGANAQSIARWNGSAWSPVGWGLSGGVFALTTLHDGDLVVGGAFVDAGGSGVDRLARWDGTSWSGFGPSPSFSVRALAPAPENVLAVGGSFQTAGGLASPYFVGLTTQCPPSAVLYGGGCSGSAGPLTLIVDELPWVGGAFRATATGLPPDSLAAGVGGLQPASMPLSAVLPQALFGCGLWTSVDALHLLVPQNGAVHAVVPIPGAAPYIGKEFYFQVVGFELSSLGAILAATSTSAAAVTVGAF